MSFQSEMRRLRRRPTIIAASLASNLFALAVPLVVLHLYDRVIPWGGMATLYALGFGLIVAAVADFFVRVSRGYLIAQASARFEAGAHERVLHRILAPGADPYWTGDDVPVAERFVSIERLRRHFGGEAASALLDFPFLLAFLVAISIISPALGIAALAVTAISVCTIWLRRRRIDRLQESHLERDRRRHDFLAESIDGIEAVRALGIESTMQRRYERLMAGSAGITRDLAAEISYTQGLAGTIGLLAPVSIACFGSYLVVTGQMTVGGLAAGVLLTGRIIQPALRMEALMAGEREIGGAARDFDALLAAPILSRGTQPVDRIDRIELEDVSWVPQPGAAPVLSGVNLILRRGDCIAIDGEDGSGRSTLLALLAGHRRPDAGQVFVNDTALEDLDPADFAARVAVLSPDHRMLPGTLFDNLTAFAPGQRGADALELAREMSVDRAVAGHREGYAAAAVRRGANGLPNAVHDGVLMVAGLVGQPDIVLFDEANSYLDRQADLALLGVLRRRLPDVITVLVTYRPSYRDLATRHYRLVDGRLEPTTPALGRLDLTPAMLAS